MKIGDQIREARNRLGMSQDDLAERIHVSRGKISHWETGLRPPKAEEIRELEEVLQCKFVIEQEQAQSPEGQTAKATDSQGEAASAEKKSSLHALLQKNVPAWLCAAIVGGVFAAMLVIMLCTTSNLQKQINALTQPVITPYSLAWFQEADVIEEGKAFITITPDQNPVMAQPNPDGGDRNIWYYQIILVEHNGIPFTVTELTMQPFNGDMPKSAKTENSEWITSAWGDNTIPANGVQYLGSGMPVQAITHMGILIKGTDANGNELQFRTLVQFSQELAE
ncbi:MAG: helix-turn-helix transcriptional regulator [Clostridia bacterium]|nr:helix-turn-helix transcriptional regulator [Clostridia bacterium]